MSSDVIIDFEVLDRYRNCILWPTIIHYRNVFDRIDSGSNSSLLHYRHESRGKTIAQVPWVDSGSRGIVHFMTLNFHIKMWVKGLWLHIWNFIFHF